MCALVQAAELATAQHTLAELTDRMFASPAWRASPHLNQLGDSVRALEGQLAEAGRGTATYGRGTQLLSGAVKKLQEATQVCLEEGCRGGGGVWQERP